MNEVNWVKSQSGINEIAKINDQNYVVSLSPGGYTIAKNPQGLVLTIFDQWDIPVSGRWNEKKFKSSDEAKEFCIFYAGGKK